MGVVVVAARVVLRLPLVLYICYVARVPVDVVLDVDATTVGEVSVVGSSGEVAVTGFLMAKVPALVAALDVVAVLVPGYALALITVVLLRGMTVVVALEESSTTTDGRVFIRGMTGVTPLDETTADVRLLLRGISLWGMEKLTTTVTLHH